ncbi:choice-of-anchor J domain-containing protein [Aeromicrobium sp. UC242_57]|uniref:choice-of-anchor J domain-containing protein n=1 Tax=Aeromicrobium sp. UC242_57 TaxID=3374624 RepID=UPI00379636EE
MNFNATTGSNTISVWLVTPPYSSLSNGDAWSFFTRQADSTFPDRLEVRMSTNGSCSAGSGPESVGDFTTLLTTVNPGLTTTGYPKTWTEISGALAGIKGAKTGCLAFRYFVTNGGPTGANSDYIGIDTYSFDDQPTDITAPDTTILTGPDGVTQDSTPSFTFESSETGSTFECAVDDATFGPCTGPETHTTGDLTDGDHTFAVRATDAAGNTDETPATRTFTVDTTAPDTTILTGPDGVTQDTTPAFTFESTETGSTFECAVDDATFGPCTGPETHTTGDLTDGDHTFAVRATDAAGNTDETPATRTFTVDTTAPDTTILTGPDADTQDTTPAFTFESTETGSTFECAVDDATFGPCTGPGTHTADQLDLGAHVFAVRATDSVGNTDATPATRTFTVKAATVVVPPKVCNAEKAAVAKAKTAVTKANKSLTSANKKLKSAKKALKKAQKAQRAKKASKHKKAKAVAKAKKKVSSASKRVKTAKKTVQKAKRNLAAASSRLTAASASRHLLDAPVWPRSRTTGSARRTGRRRNDSAAPARRAP